MPNTGEPYACLCDLLYGFYNFTFADGGEHTIGMSVEIWDYYDDYHYLEPLTLSWDLFTDIDDVFSNYYMSDSRRKELVEAWHRLNYNQPIYVKIDGNLCEINHIDLEADNYYDYSQYRIWYLTATEIISPETGDGKNLTQIPKTYHIDIEAGNFAPYSISTFTDGIGSENIWVWKMGLNQPDENGISSINIAVGTKCLRRLKEFTECKIGPHKNALQTFKELRESGDIKYFGNLKYYDSDAVDTGEDYCVVFAHWSEYDYGGMQIYDGKGRDKVFLSFTAVNTIDEKYIPNTIQRIGDDVIINSSTPGSTKKFKITVDDSGAITATEI